MEFLELCNIDINEAKLYYQENKSQFDGKTANMNFTENDAQVGLKFLRNYDNSRTIKLHLSQIF